MTASRGLRKVMKGVSLEERFWAKVNKDGPVLRPELGQCWEWQAYRRKLGYGEFRIGPRVGGKPYLAHRVAYALSVGVQPELLTLHVCHKCDNPSCVRPEHLFLGTPLDNMRDMIAKGRRRERRHVPRGSEHGMAKLTEEQVRAIRNSAGNQYEAAKVYGCSQSTIYLIRAGKIWRHVS